MSQDFAWSPSDEPHMTRRKEILETHPEVKTLYGHDSTQAWIVILFVALQTIIALNISGLSWFPFLVLTYAVGGTLNHSLALAMHEISHNLVWPKPWQNIGFGIFANLPLGIPSFIAFRHYHRIHHSHLGVDGEDVDIPSHTELKIFRGTLMKLIWVILQPFWYGLRPLFLKPTKTLSYQNLNVGVVLAYLGLMGYLGGWSAVLYLVGGTILGMGLHPMAGHFIAEHYTLVDGQETTSYYGPLNFISFNVGFHNEHHDFPFIPGSRLPLLKKMVPDSYSMPFHSSWSGVLYRYITDSSLGPYSRVKRIKSENKE